jgi:hypothetical protein
MPSARDRSAGVEKAIADTKNLIADEENLIADEEILPADKKILVADEKISIADKKIATADEKILSADGEILSTDRKNLIADTQDLTADALRVRAGSVRNFVLRVGSGATQLHLRTRPHLAAPGRTRPHLAAPGRTRSPDDLEAAVKVEALVRGHDRHIFHERLRDQLAVERVGMMCGQIEQADGMFRRVRQDPHAQVSDPCHRARRAERELPSGLFDGDLGEGHDAKLAHGGPLAKGGDRRT